MENEFESLDVPVDREKVYKILNFEQDDAGRNIPKAFEDIESLTDEELDVLKEFCTEMAEKWTDTVQVRADLLKYSINVVNAFDRNLGRVNMELLDRKEAKRNA